jgi:hypothetical protein
MPTDLKIELLPGSGVAYRRQYRLSSPEATELDRQVGVHYGGGRVQDSYSEFNSPSIMERKVGTDELRWCVDYRQLNLATKGILGLKNAPVAFMRMMHHVFAELIHKCVIIFLDEAKHQQIKKKKMGNKRNDQSLGAKSAQPPKFF